MPITMICPNLNCRQTVVAPETARGKVVRCAHCKQLFMVPTAPKDPNAAAQNEQATPKRGKKS